MRLLIVDFFSSLWRATGRRRAVALVLLSLGLVLEAGLLTILLPTIQLVVQPGAQLGTAGWTDRLVDTIGGTGDIGRLGLLLAGVTTVTLLRNLLSNWRDLSLLRVQLSFADAERRRLMQAVAFAAWNRIVQLDHARVTSAMTTEVQRLSNSAQAVLNCCVAVPSLLLQLAFAFMLEPVFASMLLAFAAGGALILLFGQRAIFELGGAITDTNRAAVANLRALLGTLKAAAAQDSRRELVDEFGSVQRLSVDRQIAFRRRQNRRRLLFTAVLSLLVVATLLAGLRVFHLAPALLIMMGLLFARMVSPAIQIAAAAQNMVYTLPALRVLRDLEAEIGQAVITPAGPQPSLPRAPLILDRVSYQHREGIGVREISVRIDSGTLCGIAGRSGQGKTTLLDVIAGLLAPQAGTLRLGDTALCGTALDSWRQHLAYVPQEGFLFPDTIRRNLGWANLQVSDAALHAAIATVGATELVAHLGGLDAIVGERGIRLSGGERQRLVLARALLRQPHWLLLDEATNALDSAAEAALLDRLVALDDRPTILLVSHREGVLARCDTIVRIDRGHVVHAAIEA